MIIKTYTFKIDWIKLKKILCKASHIRNRHIYTYILNWLNKIKEKKYYARLHILEILSENKYFFYFQN
jgi:hypothetical protein